MRRSALSITQAGDEGKKVLGYIRDQWSIGNVYVEKSQEKPRGSFAKKTLWIWSVTSRLNVIKILETMRPYLRHERRKKKVEEVLKILKSAELCTRYHKWTEDEIIFMRENYGGLNSKEISRVLRRHTPRSIQCKARKLGMFFNRAPTGKGFK